MRFKPVPEPPENLAALVAARDAVPPEPDPQADCCGLVREELDLTERDAAADWLTFMRALGLVEERSGVYVRTGEDVDREGLADAFQERVYGAREMLETLEASGEPLDAEGVADRVGVRAADPRRVERVLGWAVLLELVGVVDSGYRPKQM